MDRPAQAATERLILYVLAAGLLVTALITTNGSDHFRLPKELAFRAEAIGLVVLGAFWGTAKRRTWTAERRPEHMLAVAIVVWALFTTALSTNRALSIDSLITIIAAVVIFLVTSVAARGVSLIAIDVLMIGACINAVMVILQELKIWTPFLPAPGIDLHYGSVGLLGNPNYVGTYLVAPAVAAFVLSMVSDGARRWIYGAIGVLLVGGIAASATRTAIVALFAGLLVFVIGYSRRAAVIVFAAALLVGAVVMLPGMTLGRSLRQLAAAAARGDMQHLFSERLVPFLTAVDMTRDHPLAGVGPGCFKYQFMHYRVGLFGRYPDAWTKGFPMNWGEVHNDHLQVAAEAGLPGYALFVAAIVMCAGRRARGAASDERAKFARAFRWPLAALVAVLCLGQFPLELAAARLMLLTLGGLALSWDREHVAA